MEVVTPPIEAVLRAGREVHVAVVSERGPHVTPELYVWSGGRLWFWFAHTTLKARVLARSPEAAALVAAGDRAALLEGEVDLFDVRRPLTLVGGASRGLRALLATTAYAVRNAEDLAAFALDLGAGRLRRRPPPTRVLASLTPRRATLTGPAPGAGTGEAVVVAFPGPAVAPGRWTVDDAQVRIDPVLLSWLGVARRTPIALVADQYVAPGPAAKVGTLLRGSAEAVDGAAAGVLAVDVRTSTAWDGVVTRTTRIS